MPKFAKPILVAAGILLLAYAFAVLGLNIYLQSQGLQFRIREAAFSAVGTPVTIQGAHYAPWSGFTVSGITVPQTQGMPPFFEAASVNFRFAFLPLLQGRLAVKEVTVNSPVLISKNPPARKPAPPAETPVATPVTETPAAVEKLAGAVEITVPEQPEASRAPAIEVRRVNVRDGRAQIYDSKGGLILAAEGVRITAEVRPGGRIAGKFDIEEASAGSSVHPRRITGTFTWKAGRLVVPDIRGKLSGGELTGSFELDPATGFSATAAVDGTLLKTLAEDAGISADGAKGRLFAKGSMRGTPGDPESITGLAEIALQEARFQPLDIIRQIGDLMNIRELQMLELKTAEARLAIRNQQAIMENLVLESENLVMDATGPVGFDGKMKLRARLHLNEKLRKDLSGLLGDNFQDSERAGFRQVPFSVTGTISRPKTDLLDKLAGFRIGQDLGGLLKNLFRVPAKEKKDQEPAKEAN
ncbi:MAG: AsmA-like C-terminal region-containing protein [Verrucomicrobiae bacterium]